MEISVIMESPLRYREFFRSSGVSALLDMPYKGPHSLLVAFARSDNAAQLIQPKHFVKSSTACHKLHACQTPLLNSYIQR